MLKNTYKSTRNLVSLHPPLTYRPSVSFGKYIVKNNEKKMPYNITSQDEMFEHIRCSLGEPQVKVELCHKQLSMATDAALKTFSDISGEFCEFVYIKRDITQNDIDNDFEFDVSSLNLLNVYDVYAFDNVRNSNIFQNYHSNSVDLISNSLNLDSSNFGNTYVDSSAHKNVEPFGTGLTSTLNNLWQNVNLDSLSTLFFGDRDSAKAFFQYNNYTGKLKITDSRKAELILGNFILLYGTQSIEPETFTKIYDNALFRDLSVAIAKKIWAMSLGRKYVNAEILGGVTLNGDQLYNEAMREIDIIEEKINDRYFYIDFEL